MDTLIKPLKKKRISKEASSVHGITIKMLQDAPSFKDIYPKFCEIIGSKIILIFNAKFDAKILAQTASQDGVTLKDFNSYCIMTGYAMYEGDWSEYHKDYRYKKLQGGDHTAIGDCKATLKLIKKMADAEKSIIPERRWWQIFD